jgi:hypothetical protein
MVDSNTTGDSGGDDSQEAISIVQRGNLKTLERTLRKQWRLGQHIVLCWSADERGLLVILVPHYFLGNYCAVGTTRNMAKPDNETFVRELIAGSRRKTREELFAVSARLDVAPTFIKLGTALAEDERVTEAVDQLIRRYGLSYVESRAVLLFDIVEFSLFTPFEQASQLNSLSYSLNSAYNKLLSRGIEINFARTTTGDGYYVWNRALGADANRDLFFFMLLVLADNAVARAASRGNTVPVIRSGYHIGSHYELYQAEGVNPSVFSYIVGDVTIDLARMLDTAAPHQILLGEFHAQSRGGRALDTASFVRACDRELEALRGTQLSNRTMTGISCYLTESVDECGVISPQRQLIVDKHGLARNAYNLQLDVDLDGTALSIGIGPQGVVGGGRVEQPGPPDSADDLIDDLANLLQKRRSSSED